MTAKEIDMLIFLAAAVAEADIPMIPAFFTGETLYEICRRENSGQCSMYVAGVLDGLFYARSTTEQPQLCPDKMNNREAAEAVTDYLESNPEIRARAAAVGVREALAGKLVCGRPTRTAATG